MMSQKSKLVFGFFRNFPIKIINRLPRHASVVVGPHLDPNPNLLTQESGGSKRRRTSTEVSADDKFDIGLGVLLSNINNDLLLEIFLRLSNCRSAIQLSSVCRLWHALISQSQFIPRFIRLRRDADHSYTILFRINCVNVLERPKYYQLVCTIFSEESFHLHGNHSLSSSNYLDFMPSLMVVRASCNDLLLVSPDCLYHNPRDPKHQRLYICNPVTRKWFLIPREPPHATIMGFALICMPHYNQPSNTGRYSYKVVLVDRNESKVQDHYRQTVWVFCSQSTEWTKHLFFVPFPSIIGDRATNPNVVSCNGILYWMDALNFCDRIVSLDLACNRCDVIYYPDIVRNTNRCSPDTRTHLGVPDTRTHLGVVKGELRLLHVLRNKLYPKRFVMRVWELDHQDGSWALIGQRDLSFWDVVSTVDGRDTVFAAVFHPNDCDLVFIICGKSVYECGVSNDKCRRLGEIHESVGDEGLASFVLMHPPWPTPVPCA